MKTFNKIIIATVLFLGLVGCSGNESKIVKTEEFEDHGFTVIRATMKNESRLLFVVQKNNPQEVEVYSDYDQTLKGDLVIPEKVTCNKTTYKVTSIGEEAFEFSDLTSVNLPNSITRIGEEAFYGCRNLTSIVIPNCVSIIGPYAFDECEALASITIPSGLTIIESGVFGGCKALSSITIPENVNSIGGEAFMECEALSSIAIPNSVTMIGNYAFNNCCNLTSITIPNSVSRIEPGVFGGCKALSSIIIPESVNYIGKGAFLGCESLSSVTIPNNVASIDPYAFSGCTNLNSISVSEGNTRYDSRNNCNAIIETSSATIIQGCINTKIPESIISIGEGAFSECDKLTSIIIPNSVTNIGENAFANCKGLSSINIPNSICEIGNLAFMECENLNSVTISNGVNSIGEQAFVGCKKLSSIIIPQSVLSIGEGAFNYCTGLTSVIIQNPYFSFEFGKVFIGCEKLLPQNVVYQINGDNMPAFEGNVFSSYQNANDIPTEVFMGQEAQLGASIQPRIIKTEEYVTRDGHPYIRATYDNGMHLDYMELRDNTLMIRAFPDKNYNGPIYIPEKVTYNSVSYPVTKMDMYTFHKCSGITSVYIPKTMKTIGYLAFCGCSGLTSITIPNSVTKIEERAFGGCYGLTSVTIPSSVTELGEGAFGHCKRLSSVIIQNPNLKYDYDKVFYGCDNLQPQNVVYETKGSNMSVHEGSLSPSASSQSIPTSQPQKVYSNAYDGFVNIRQAPQSKAPILGVLRNGPEGAILLSTEGEWKKIDCNGIVGYVYEKYVQDTPTEVFHGE